MPRKTQVAVGQQYANLVVLQRLPNASNGDAVWLCRCACESETRVRSSNLTSGHTRSCGCLQISSARQSKSHGKSYDRTYRIWANMKARCTNPSSTFFSHYGGRGISYAPEWERFEIFHEEMGDCPPGLTIERVNNDGNYCKSNCVWASRKQQARNKRGNHLLAHAGEEKTIIDWAESGQIDATTLLKRIRRGWSVEDALNTPKLGRGCRLLTQSA